MWSSILDKLKKYSETNYSGIGQMLSKVTQYVWLSLLFIVFMLFYVPVYMVIMHLFWDRRAN